MNTRTPPPGGDTRLSGEVEEVCARLEQRCGRGSVEHEAADLLRQLAADNATRKALCEEAIELGKSYQSRLQACEAERDRLKAELEAIANPEYGIGFNRLRGIARAALAGRPRPTVPGPAHGAHGCNERNALRRARQALKDNDHE